VGPCKSYGYFISISVLLLIKGRSKGTQQIVYISYVLFGALHYCVSFLCFSLQRDPGTKTKKITIKVLMLSGPQYMWILRIENYFVTNAQFGQCCLGQFLLLFFQNHTTRINTQGWQNVEFYDLKTDGSFKYNSRALKGD